MQAVGIDLDGETINLAILDDNKDLIDVKSFNSKALNGSKDVKPLYTSSKEKTLVSTGLDLQDVLIKNVPFSVKKSFFLKKAVSFQNDLITTIDPAKTISVPTYIKDRSILKFFITTKELLTKHLSRFSHLSIDPDFVTCQSVALCRFSNHYFNNNKTALLVHIGQNKTSCVFMKDSTAEKTFNIKIGSSKLKSAYLEDKRSKGSHIDVLTLSKTSKLKTILQELREAIENAFISFVNKEEKKHPLLLTGDIQNYSNLAEFIQNDKVSSILNNEELETNPVLKSFAISFGLALNILSNDKHTIQFRKDEFTPVKTLKALGKKVLFFSIFSIICLSLIYLSSSYFLNNKEKELHSKLIELDNFENKLLDGGKILSHKDFYSDLDIYEKNQSKQMRAFPFFLKTPNVSQTISWINNHKYLQGSEIINFSYSLEKYPSIFSKNEPYLAKVEVEFKTKIPAIARGFYDSLMKGDGLVNNKEEITWDVGNDCYKTSFYLKCQKPKNLK